MCQLAYDHISFIALVEKFALAPHTDYYDLNTDCYHLYVLHLANTRLQHISLSLNRPESAKVTFPLHPTNTIRVCSFPLHDSIYDCQLEFNRYDD